MPMPRADHKFVVRHQVKQTLILRALEEMDTSRETPEETAAATAMLVRLQQLLRRRKRRRLIGRAIGRREEARD